MFSFLPPPSRRKGWLLLGVCLLCSVAGWSQQAELQKIAPLSPNAASLLRYTETDIGHFTGSASIGFPLHTVKSGSLSLNLSLGYSSTGNKVEDIASWVGLGWNLTTIPVVTRTVRGLPDEEYPGISIPYMGKKIQEIIEISNTVNHPSGLTGEFICQIANGQLDTEPDYFHYTLADGRSGYFYWDPYKEKYQTTPYRNLTITKTGAGSIDAIQIVDDFGNIYRFGDYETSQSSGMFNSPVSRNAWYVSTITNSNKTDAIHFGYGTYSVVTRTLNPMRKELNGFCPDNSSLISTTTVQTKIPWMITSAEGSVTFVGADNFREDLNGSYALKSLEVRDNANTLIKKINLHYEYTTAISYDPLCSMVSSFSYEQKRLFLKSFAEMSLTGTDSVMHSFQYNHAIVAPCRVSAAQDFWGYYNAQHSNQNLIPEIPKGIVFLPQAAPGANRFVNPSVNQFGILNRIYLPTGGYTDIEYETHRVLDENKEFPAVYLDKTAYLLPEHEVSSNTFMDTISIYSDRDLFINNDNAGGSFVNIILGDKECVSDPPPAVNCAQLFIRGIDAWNSDVNFPVVSNMQLYHLKKGRYELKAMFAQAPVSEQGFFMYLKWREVDTTYKHAYIGGLRVKRITTIDSAGSAYTKRYQYTNGLNSDTSSGKPIAGSAFFRVQQANCTESSLANYIVADNSTMLTSHGGSFVGYGNVIELRDSLATQGYTQYQFDYLRDEFSNLAPFIPAWDNSEFRGHPINTKIFAKTASGFKLLSEERNQYFNYLMDSLAYTAMKTFKVLNGPACDIGGGGTGLLYWSEPYPYAPRIALLRNKRAVAFNLHTSDSIVTNQEFIYNIKNMQVSRQISKSSKGENLDQFTYYAVDSAASGNTAAVWDTLIKRNMIVIPLKQVSQTNGVATSTFISKYAQASGSGYMQLRELWQGYLTQTPEAKVFYNYTSADKLSEQQKANDVKEVYLWGYGGQYPVAKILNSTYAVASTYITPSILNSPSSDAALRTHLNNLRSITGAMVITYTYKPGVGVTSETDANGRTTYYEYDTHNRLSLVRDHDNNILKKICYNYAGQPETCGVISYTSAVASGSFTKNNCGSGATGGTVTYTVPAGTYTSTISQTDANLKATNDVTANGQAYANANANCTWTNQAQSGNFTRNNCGTNGTGSTITYTIAAGTYSSTTSQAAANTLAINAVNSGGQAYANANAGCTWTNQAQSGSFTRNNCGTNGTGSTVTYTIAAGSYSSTTSLAAANTLAINAVNAGGQAYANANAGCTWTNQAQSGSFTRNNCGTNGTGSTITYTVAAGTHSSTTSLAAANTLAINAVNAGGQAYANANAGCTWVNQAQSASFTRNNCTDGGSGGSVTYTVANGTYSSTTSLAAANTLAVNAVNANGQTYANANAGCTWTNNAQSGNFTRNNCTNGGSGGTVTYTISAGTYSSTVSKADANTQATNAVNAGGQSYANSNATCTWTNDATSASYTRNNCGPGYIGGSLSYTINAGAYSSTVSKADANQQAVNARNSLGQANANANASCTLSVYAKLSYENINSGWGNGTYGDVVIRFYADAACTQSVSVPSLTLNLDTEGFDGSNTFSYSFTESASGSYHVLGYNVELSYDDGSTYRFRDYYLLSGSNYTVVW